LATVVALNSERLLDHPGGAVAVIETVVAACGVSRRRDSPPLA
jgi:hypothetical protein